MKFIQSNIFNLFIGFLVIINLMAIIAPVAAYFELHWIADPIYAFYSLTCHQFHWRSVHINDHQVAWCTRDMFIWASFLAVSIGFKTGYIKEGLMWYWLIPFTIPIALDGGIQTLATFANIVSTAGEVEIFYLSTNLTRMITGALFGMGLGVVIAPFLQYEQIRANNIHNFTT